MARELNIAVWYNLPTGGAKRALHDHVEGLMKRGHSVTSFRPQVVSPGWQQLPCKEVEIPQRIYGDESTYLRRVVKHVMRPTLAMKAMIDHSKQAAEQIDSQGFDVLFANTCCQYHSPFIGRFSKTPALLYLQEPNRFIYEALPRLPWLGPPAGSSLPRRIRGLFDILALRRQAEAELANAKSYRRILVNSYYSRESVARAYGISSHVCYLGVDTDRYVPIGDPREPYLLGVGALAVPKRVELAIKSVAELGPKRPPLVWVANYVDETYKSMLVALARESGVDLDIRFLIPDEELVALLQRASAVLYTPTLEPFGYVPLEAAACGAPVVAVAEGGLRETMSDGLGWVCDPEPDAIAACIQEILADPAKASQHVLSQRDRLVERWNLSAAIDRLESHLLEVAEGRG